MFKKIICFILLVVSGNMATEGIRTEIHDEENDMTLASFIGDEETISRNFIRKIEEFIVPTLNISTNYLCRNHSEIYIKGLRNLETWAYQMLDSTAKLQSGLLTGNVVSMGNFDECIGVMSVQTEFGNFSGKHCLATLTWENDTFLSTMKLFKKLQNPGMPKSMTLLWGFCIPSSCRSEDLMTGLKDLLNEDIDVKVSDMDCHVKVHKELKTTDLIAITVFAAFGLLVILSTTYDLSSKGKKKEIFLAFSVYTNGKRLLSTKVSSDVLPSLHGIRFLSICWIVLGHRYMISSDGPAINLLFKMDFIKSKESVLIANSVLGVDTFLVLSGFLVSYLFLKQMNSLNREPFNVFLYYLHRYLRLTPVLAVMILLQVSLIDRMGSGPQWDKYNSFLTQLCKENWWSALLYIQNYVSGDRMCVGHSWYLSVDMQLIWLSPLLFAPLLRWPRRKNLFFLGAITAAGIVTSFCIMYVNKLPAGIRAGVGPKWDERNKYEYVKTHTRFTPWIVGFGLGYIVYETNRKVQLTKLQQIFGWILSTVGFIGSLYGILPFQQPDYEYNAFASAIYVSLHRSVWALSLSWLIFACVSGYGGPLNTLLSWKVFYPFSRLTYSIYLVHFTFILSRQLATRVPSYLDHMNLISLFFSDLGFSILLASVLYLVFESPVITIERILLKGRKQEISVDGHTNDPSNTIEDKNLEVGGNSNNELDVTKPTTTQGITITPIV